MSKEDFQFFENLENSKCTKYGKNVISEQRNINILASNLNLTNISQQITNVNLTNNIPSINNNFLNNRKDLNSMKNLTQNNQNFTSAHKSIISAASGTSYRESESLLRASSFGISDSYPSSTCSFETQKVEEPIQIKRAKLYDHCDMSTQQIIDISKIETQTSSSESKDDKLNSSNDSDLDLNLVLNILEDEKKFYGLPMKVKDLLKKLRNISCLYDWQHELLTQMQKKYITATTNLANNKFNNLFTNLLYLSPTSGGKTLVAEMLILHCLLVRKKNCIFVMPFVSIVQEKVQQISDFAEALNFHVEEYAGLKGTMPPLKRQLGKKRTLYICTIEKAHSLINSLIETDRLTEEIGLLCADELHMIGEDSRGAIYEMILSKIKYYSEQMITQETKKNEKKCLPIQIVATTATLENKHEIAKFLNAYLYERNFRPVELKEYVKMDKQVFEVDKTKLNEENLESIFKLVREIDTSSYSNELKKADQDGLIGLVKEIIPNESCLIFCQSKKNCENVASLLATYLPPEMKQHKRDLKLKLFNELKEENSNNICPVLRKSLQFGIAYHHSGLTTEERQLIEQAYREGVLCLLTCTSTLAAGVNLPAKRVIIRSPYVALDFISSSSYRQMIGRAGRAGLIDSVGESILLFKNVDKLKVVDLITGPMKRCESALQCDSKSLKILVLSLIGLKMTHLGSKILHFIKTTLFYLQQGEKIFKSNSNSNYVTDELNKESNENQQKISLVPDEFDLISDALDYLLKNNFIQVSKKDSLIDLSNPDIVDNRKSLYYVYFEITKLGTAAIKGNIDLELVSQLFSDLKLGLKTMVLANYLHLLYLCTPYDLANSLNNVDYDTYVHKYNNLTEDEVKCACIIGVQEDYLQKKRFNNKTTSKKVDENVVKRFYMTLIIYELWKTQNSIWKVAGEFQLDRGFVQQIVQSAASFTSGVMHFCEHLDEFWPYKNLLQEFTKRLQFNCSSIDLIPLLELDGVRLPRAKQLYTAGFTNIESIASSNPDDMAGKIRNMPVPVAKKLIKSAKILQERIEVLQTEADNLLLQLKIE